MDIPISRNLVTGAPVTNRELLHLLKAALDKAFPCFVERVTLFGSQANGTATDNSDWDVLLMLTRECDWQLRVALLDVCTELALEYEDVIFDVKMLSPLERLSIRGRLPYVQAALQEGIAA